MNITDISGIGDATAQRLKTHEIDSVEAVAQASIEQLAAVPGIGEDRAAALRESARRLLPEAGGEAQTPNAVPGPGGDGEGTKRRKDWKEKKGKEKEGKKNQDKKKKGRKDKTKGRKKKKNKRK